MFDSQIGNLFFVVVFEHSSLFKKGCVILGNIPSLLIFRAMLEGLAVNPNVNAVDLDVSSNDLGTGKDPRHMMKVLARTKCLYQLNLSECGLDHILPEVISAVDENHKLKHIFIGKNFGGKNK